ncbi:MAG TPA: cytochrome c3 family protein [Gemmatimonadales bacterium]|jgi:hypothetical protein
MRKRLFLGLGVLAIAAVATLTLFRRGSAQQTTAGKPVVAAVDPASLKGPRQPIFFRHDIHVGRNQMQCQYCHYTVGVSNEPGIPSMQTCMGCHFLYVTGSTPQNKAEIAKLNVAWQSKTPVQWVRVHTLARHVHFPHSLHIKALGPQACATCHGNVARMAQVFKVNNVNNMGFCINCHIERKVSRDCSQCHF